MWIHTHSHMCIYMDFIYIYIFVCVFVRMLGGLKFFRAQNILSSKLSTSVVNCYLTRYIGYRRIPTDLAVASKYFLPTLWLYQLIGACTVLGYCIGFVISVCFKNSNGDLSWNCKENCRIDCFFFYTFQSGNLKWFILYSVPHKKRYLCRF